MMNLIKFKPIFAERVWGGDKLKTILKRDLPADRLIGECWDVCDRNDTQSIISGGAFDSMTIRDILKKYPTEIMGPGWDVNRLFPIIAKWLDCKEKLSLQVHPDVESAANFGGEAKAEAWYFYQCEDYADYVVGMRPHNNSVTLLYGILRGTLDHNVIKRKAKAGDFIFIERGCIHSAGGGNLIFEVQENSVTTYRVFDWCRQGLDGNPRELHIKESLNSIDFRLEGSAPTSENWEKERHLCKCDKFKMTRLLLADGEVLSYNANEQPRLITVLDGVLKSEKGDVYQFETGLLPYSENFEFTAEGDVNLIVTEDFV